MLNCMVTCRNADKKPHDNNLETSTKITPIDSQKGVMSMFDDGASTLGNLATKLGIDSDNLNALRIGGLLHDIGKIKTPSKILTKKANLSEEEYTEIKKHPLIGAQILSNVSVFCDIIPIVKYHHERYDGTGYPEHLKGEEIPLLARIVSVADSFDAMSSKRSYKDNMDIQQIINEISNNKNTQFDSHVADALLEILTNNYNAIIEIQNRSKIED